MGRFFLLFPGKNLLSFLPFLPSFCWTKVFPPLWFNFWAKIFYISKIISSISPLCFISSSWTKCFPEFSPPRFFISCLTSNLQTLIRCQSIRLSPDEDAMTSKACGEWIYQILYREFPKSPKQQKTKPVDEYKPKYLIHHKFESDLKVFLTTKEHDAALSENVVSLLTQVLHWWHHKRTRCTIR